MRLQLLLHIFNFCGGDFSSADRALLLLAELVLNVQPKGILFYHSFHEPVSADAEKVESVQALIDSHQIYSICEGCYLRIWVFKDFEANCTSSFQSVVKISQYFSNFFVHFIQITLSIFVFLFLLRQVF